jgi:hypothetical protein
MKRSFVWVFGLMFSGTAQAACGWGGSASDFFRCLMDTSVVVDDHAATLAEVDGRVGSLEDATWDLSSMMLTAGDVLSTVAGEGYALLVDIAPVGLTGSFMDLTDVPASLADGDDDTLGMLVCVDGEVPVASGAGWVCGVGGDVTSADLMEVWDRLDEVGSSASPGSTVMHGDVNVINTIDLEALRGFQEVTGFIKVDNRPTMPDVDPLSSLEVVGQEVEFTYNGALTDVSGLMNLQSVGRALVFRQNYELESILLPVLVSMESLEISDNDDLTSIDLSSLTEVGNLYIHGNNVLASLDLSSLTTVEGTLTITENWGICQSEMEALADRLTVTGDTYVSNNDDGC